MAVQTGNDINNSMRTKASRAVIGGSAIHNAQRNHRNYAPIERARIVNTTYSYKTARTGYNVRQAGEVRGKIMADRIDGYGRFRSRRATGRENNIASMRSGIQTNALRKIERTRKVKVNGKYAWQLTKNTGIRSLRGANGMLSAAELATISQAGAMAQATGNSELASMVSGAGAVTHRVSSGVRRGAVSIVTGDGKRRIRVERQQQLNKANKDLYKADRKLERSINKYDKAQTRLDKLRNNGRNPRSIRNAENRLMRQDRKVLTNAQIKQRAMGQRAQALRKVKAPINFKAQVTKALATGIKSALFSVAGLFIGLTVFTLLVFMIMMAGAGGGAAEDLQQNNATMSGDAAYVANYLLDHGMSPEQAAAVMGNMCQETSGTLGIINAQAIESNGEGYGLIQWSFGRKSALLNYATSHGGGFYANGVPDISSQMDFFWEEWNASGPHDGINWGSDWKAVFDATNDINYCTQVMFDHYEQPGDASLPFRQQAAIDFYAKIVSGALFNTVDGGDIIEYGRQFVGNPYVWGGSSLTNGCDCSHFVWLVLKGSGRIPESASYFCTADMLGSNAILSDWNVTDVGTNLANAQPGDIVVYQGHTGLVDENGMLLEAKGSQWGITNDRAANCKTVLRMFRCNSAPTGGSSGGTSLGTWRLTAYQDIPSDQGRWVGQTASGATPIPGRTVAVSSQTMSRLGLHFGDKLRIKGHTYTIEDHGDSNMANQNWVDIFVGADDNQYSDKYNGYAEVFLIR